MVSAYTTALRMLARRELSTSQVRDRLRQRGFTREVIDDAVSRLTANGTLDDARVARAVARTRAHVKRQGRQRVARELALLGIPDQIAEAALSDVFGDLGEAALLEQALERRLRGRISLSDPAARRRIVAALVRQGFAPGAVMRAMRTRSRT
jgi:regulatory protein